MAKKLKHMNEISALEAGKLFAACMEPWTPFFDTGYKHRKSGQLILNPYRFPERHMRQRLSGVS